MLMSSRYGQVAPWKYVAIQTDHNPKKTISKVLKEGFKWYSPITTLTISSHSP